MFHGRKFRTEKKLVEACLAGDQAAWCKLFRQYDRWIALGVYARLDKDDRNKNQVDELRAEVWYRLGRRRVILEHFDSSRGCLRAYFFGLGWHLARRFYEDRAAKKKRQEKKQTGHEVHLSDAHLALREWIASADEAAIREFKSTLSPEDAEFLETQLLGNQEGHEVREYTDENYRQHKHLIFEQWKAFRKQQ